MFLTNGQEADLSYKMGQVNGLAFLLVMLACGGCVRATCYNGPAPVIVNPDADVYLGMSESFLAVSSSPNGYLFQVVCIAICYVGQNLGYRLFCHPE